jgi:hypothetical protein
MVGTCKKARRLLDIPLLAEALGSSDVKIVRRPIDRSWLYEGIIPASVSGFNPFHRSLFIDSKSSLAGWLDGGRKNDRAYNERDFLVHEALFLVHDYLHCWATQAIQNELPELQFGTGEINRRSLEDFAFCHLLTEAVATVGLDYWYLSTVDLNEVVDLGTARGPLTVGYRERDLAEYRRFHPKFEAQTPNFFKQIALFYARGSFEGFTIGDIRKSPKLLNWIEHELAYGEKQREYTRAWLLHLSNGKVFLDRAELGLPIVVDQPWQKALIENLGARLWQKVKLGKVQAFGKSVPMARLWKRDPALPIDFRFTNLNAVSMKRAASIGAGPYYAENFDAFFAQFVSGFEFKSFPSEYRAILGYILEKKDIPSLTALFRGLNVRPVVAPKSGVPADLFLLS